VNLAKTTCEHQQPTLATSQDPTPSPISTTVIPSTSIPASVSDNVLVRAGDAGLIQGDLTFDQTGEYNSQKEIL
jgi:hypothetical protein